MKINKEIKENLIEFLQEYLSIFKSNKEHQRLHQKEVCPKCRLAKQLLRKLKK